MEPAIEESIVTFGCPPQLVLNGPDSSTCNRNGEWEPDPRYLQCLGEYIIHLISFIMIVFGLDHIADCRSPSPPPSGYILPYPSTLEGATLTYVCWSIQQGAGLCGEVNKTAVCNRRGQWEPSADDICTQPEGVIYIPGTINHNYNIIIVYSTLYRGWMPIHFSEGDTPPFPTFCIVRSVHLGYLRIHLISA